MNNFIGIGRFTDDPEVIMSKEEKPRAIAKYQLAIQRRFINPREPEVKADYFYCVSFGPQAEFIKNNMKKGMRVAIIAEVRNNNYEKDGVKHYGTQMIVSQIEFADSKKGSDSTEKNETIGEEFGPASNDPNLPFN